MVFSTSPRLVRSRNSKVQSRCNIVSPCKDGSRFIEGNGRKKNEQDQVVVHEAIGRVGIKVIERQKERKKDPDAKS